MPDTKIGNNCRISKSVIGSEANLEDSCKVGDGENIALVGDGIMIGSGESIC